MSHHNSGAADGTPKSPEGSPEDYRLTCAGPRRSHSSAPCAALRGPGRRGRVLTFHEVVFATPAKEMLQSGQWIVPTIAGDPFNDRTPLTAWSIAASMWLFGTDAEWVVRVPNVLFSIAAALLMASMAARWFGKRTGILAGFIELTTLQVLTNGRLAEADMLLCAIATASMYAFAAATVDGPRGISFRAVAPLRILWILRGVVPGEVAVRPRLHRHGLLCLCAVGPRSQGMAIPLPPGRYCLRGITHRALDGRRLSCRPGNPPRLLAQPLWPL